MDIGHDDRRRLALNDLRQIAIHDDRGANRVVGCGIDRNVLPPDVATPGGDTQEATGGDASQHADARIIEWRDSNLTPELSCERIK